VKITGGRRRRSHASRRRAKANPGKTPASLPELGDDDLRSIFGGTISRPGATGGGNPVCIGSASGG
jgi:hypothetical protein